MVGCRLLLASFAYAEHAAVASFDGGMIILMQRNVSSAAVSVRHLKLCSTYEDAIMVLTSKYIVHRLNCLYPHVKSVAQTSTLSAFLLTWNVHISITK